MGNCFNNFIKLKKLDYKKVCLITTILTYYKHDVENTKILIAIPACDYRNIFCFVLF